MLNVQNIFFYVEQMHFYRFETSEEWVNDNFQKNKNLSNISG